MGSFLASVRAALSPRARQDRRNIAALAAQLGIPEQEAALVYRRSREAGFGAAMREREAAGEEDNPGDAGTAARENERIA